MYLAWLRTRVVAQEAAALRKAAGIAAAATPFMDPLQLILEAALPVVPADHIALLRVRADRMESTVLAAAGAARPWRWLRAPIAPGSTVARAIETGETQRVADDAAGAGARMRRSVVVVPVILGGAVFGVLESARDGRGFSARHATLLRAFADQCAAAIHNAATGRRGASGG